MLELLIFQYKDMFGAEFPLRDFEGQPEIDVINILYDCVQNNRPYEKGQPVRRIITDAPGQEEPEE